MRIFYHTTDFLPFDDDIKETFRHWKYHPYVTGVFTYIVSNILYFPLGGNFESATSPASFKPLDRARTHLAQRLSRIKELIPKQIIIIYKVKYSDPPNSKQTYGQSKIDAQNNGV